MSTVRVYLPTRSPTAKEARKGGKQSWWRHVESVDRNKTGAFALIPHGDPFLRAGEHDLEVGSVLVFTDCDLYSTVAYVTPAGLAWVHYDEADGQRCWFDLKEHSRSLCDEVARALALPLATVMRSERARLTTLLAHLEAKGQGQYVEADQARTALDAFITAIADLEGKGTGQPSRSESVMIAVDIVRSLAGDDLAAFALLALRDAASRDPRFTTILAAAEAALS